MSRCSICAANGVDAPAVAGGNVCAFHLPPQQQFAFHVAPEVSIDTGRGIDLAMVDDPATGLSQDVADLQLVGGPPGLPVRGGGHIAAGTVVPSPGLTVSLRDELMVAFVEKEILQHFPLVAASNRVGGVDVGAAICYPRNWADLKVIFGKLGYNVEAQDAWQVLGMALLDGPDPSTLVITNRQRTVQMLCGLAKAPAWSPEDLGMVQSFLSKVNNAAAHCQDSLQMALAQRKRLKVPRLHLHKELGDVGFQFLACNLPPDTVIATQWSDVLGLKLQEPADICRARNLAALAEKGDDKFWAETVGSQVVMWAPADANALTRFLSQYLRRTSPESRPDSLYLVAPIPLQVGMGSMETITDLWSTPILAARWMPIVRNYTFTSTPLEMVMPGAGLPKHVFMGLAVFQLGHYEPRGLPRMLEPNAPLCAVPEPRVLVLDVRVENFAGAMAVLQVAELQGIISRNPRRSPLSTTAVPRMCIDWILPGEVHDMDILLHLRGHRGETLAVDTYYGLRSMISHRDALILESSSPLAVHHYWALCTQLVAISPHKFVVYSASEPEVWSRAMDRVMQNDADETSVRLRWRASKNGGRTVAAPTATTKALAASRRRGTAPITLHDFHTDVVLQGEVGKEDGQVLRALMNHAIQATGLQIKETDYQGTPQVGDYIHLASQDPTAPPGKIRVLLSTADEVRRLHNALHGQTIQVGQDRVGILVGNDLVDSRGVPGNDRRGRV